jgi:hypothetical protein
MPEVFARLSRDRKRALCGRRTEGRQTCRGDIATIEAVHGIPSPAMWVEIDAGRKPPPARELHFSLGWSKREGVWQLSKHALGDIKYGRPPSFRRKPKGMSNEEFEQSAYYSGRIQPRSFPARARCPECSTVQVLDLTVLELTHPHDLPVKFYPRRKE